MKAKTKLFGEQMGGGKGDGSRVWEDKPKYITDLHESSLVKPCSVKI